MNKLEVNNLCVAFFPPDSKKAVGVVSGLSYCVEKSSVLALVGESGCGKSVGTLALTGLFNTGTALVSADSIKFFDDDGSVTDLAKTGEKEMRRIRGGKIAYIFQDPGSSLNPVFKIGSQIAEVIKLHRPEVRDVRSEVVRLLNEVGIPSPEKRFDAYPHELSGGMQQRVMIAMALAGNPQLLIADEPTTALDVTIQAQILELLDDLRREKNMTVLLITHNLGIVAGYADHIAVMYAGELVEASSREEILRHPMHPYTKALLAAVPDMDSDRTTLFNIPGSVPQPSDYPPYCRFYDRCPERDAEKCKTAPCQGFSCKASPDRPEHFCRCIISAGEKTEAQKL